jgi:Ca2+-binding EF-hand superfamily protein
MTSNRILRNPLVLAVLGLALAAAALSAQSVRHEGHERMFLAHHTPMAEADTNGDGAVDAAEWNALFAKLDADGNGKIDEAEMARHHGFPPPEALAFMLAHEADANRDGKVTAAEWKARVAALDENKDGALATSELPFHRRHAFGGDDEEEASGLPPFAAQWDANDNGVLDAGELDALFAAADEDHDGVLTFPHERHHRF